MPRYIVAASVLLAVYLGGVRVVAIFKLGTRVPWYEGLPLVQEFLEQVEGRLLVVWPMLFYAGASLLAGVIEGIYWRSHQVWQGYHRYLAELAVSPLVIAFGLTVNWALSLWPQPLFTLWIACLLLGVFGWCLSAGYRAASVR